MKPRALILKTAGTNCDGETAHAFELAGAHSVLMHINRLLEQPGALQEFQMLAIPGGFSYGDDIAAGRIFANQISHHLREPLAGFLESGKPVIGICNGFQVLVKTDLLPGPIGAEARGQTATLTSNDGGRFIDRWVGLEPRPSRCIWTEGLEPLELPVAHGEGKFVPADNAVLAALWENRQVALVYAQGDNPNGSIDNIAGVCDASGLIFGLMPHPERHVSALQHPAWSKSNDTISGQSGPGLRIFSNAVRHVQSSAGVGV
jgi:phosphoribosylformylglycinamidine synthase